MTIVSKVFISIIAFEHFYIMIMEMFLWEKKGPSIFKQFDKDLFAKTTAMAKNMGIYNSFLAAGLIWSLFISNAVWAINIAMFFLICAVIAGIYAAFTAEKSIFIKQSIPSLISLVVLIILN